MTDPSEGDQDEIQIQAARNILAEVDDPRELRDALENVLAIADKLVRIEHPAPFGYDKHLPELSNVV